MYDVIALLANALAPVDGAPFVGALYDALLIVMHVVADAVTGYVTWSPDAGWDIVLHEDSPLWDCHLDGNGICGPGA